MATIGYHASHEQFSPSALLRYAKLAEEAGFQAGMCSDHFAWLPKHDRMARLRECADVMRALFAGETVSHSGHVQVDEAKLWTLPDEPPMLVGAAISVETAEWVGGWADALVTVAKPRADLEETVAAFRRGGDDGKPMFLQVQLSWATSDEQAGSQALDQWRNATLPPAVQTRLHMPAEFDDVGEYVRIEDLEPHIRMSADLERHTEWLTEDAALGFDALYLHNVGPNQEAFIEAFGASVLPELG
jgi:coenzyme F420-dependent glucose-6-phosphate dehydrogenase